MLFYRPSVEHAYEDVRVISAQVPFGWLIRNTHRWAGHAMVVFVGVHMARVFLTGSYKAPRQLNWVIGVALLVLTLALSFTGYLLPWDQLAFWAVNVATELAASMPLVGHAGPGASLLGVDASNDIRTLLLGGPATGSPTLVRFYALHCFVLPGIVLVLSLLHFWRVRRDGGVRGNL
jgi:quinol-cytochrome oxidoreductase complex cytochrome b subunit